MNELASFNLRRTPQQRAVEARLYRCLGDRKMALAVVRHGKQERHAHRASIRQSIEEAIGTLSRQSGASAWKNGI
jgi:hypothetical protein